MFSEFNPDLIRTPRYNGHFLFSPSPPPPSPRSVSVLHWTGFDRIFQEQSTFIESGFVPIRVFSTSTFGLGRYTYSMLMSEPTAKKLCKEDMYVCPLNRDIYIYIYLLDLHNSPSASYKLYPASSNSRLLLLFFFLFRQSKVMLLTFPLSFRMICGELEQGKFATT